MSSPITSVQATQLSPFSQTLSATVPDEDTRISLSVRGRNFEMTREELTALPESILLCLFPSGLMLEDQLDSSIPVDFDPDTLAYVLDFFRKALEEPQSVSLNTPALAAGKTAIIVLKEDLDFYIIPPKGTPIPTIIQLRRLAADHLVSNASIFDGLRKQDSTSQGNSAERHLIDMLCASGFQYEDNWSKRFIEPRKTCITSLALAHLSPSDSSAALATSQKLLLFWRKPARKCWWDGLALPQTEVQEQVKIWARRVWTLELSIIG